MHEISSAAARSFAVEVVRTLRAANYQALWAGGCVRDQLLGLAPKDYDVATNAQPEQIRQLFGIKRTLMIGAAFGVVTVLGPRAAGQVEVATFRCDGAYHDGRHPASVTFSTAELDAGRRDFTINGLFFDPIENRVHDYVGGQEDLRLGIVRAIRDPHERFHEDKLRMLRAVRFAATFGFEIEANTLAAVSDLASEIVIVSAERIAAEMRRMLIHPRRSLAVRYLRESGLLTAILPEAVAYDPQESHQDSAAAALRWNTTLALLDALVNPDFPTALAILMRGICHLPSDAITLEHALRNSPLAQPAPKDIAAIFCRRWKLSNEEIDIVRWLLGHEATIRAATEIAWPQLQRVLVESHISQLLTYATAVERVLDGEAASVSYCRQKLALPPEELNPVPLLTGDDMKRLGLRPGPAFKQVLHAVRNAQLEKLIHTPAEAFSLAQQLHAAQL